MFVTPGGVFFLDNFSLKIDRSRLLFPIFNEFDLTLWIHDSKFQSSSDWKFWSSIICSDTERLEMLIVLHICSYPRRMIAATCVLVTLRLSYQTISPERCIVTYLWVNLIFNRIIHLIICVLGSILSKLMKYSRRLLTLKGFSATSIFFGSARYLLVHLDEFSNHPRSVSLIPDRWKNYSQVSPR